jgi:hypothetical protein
MAFNFGNFAANYFQGEQLIADLQDKQAATDLKKQQVEESKMQQIMQKNQLAQQQQQQAFLQKQLGAIDKGQKLDAIASGAIPDADSVQMAQKAVKVYQAKAQAYELSGRPADAERYDQLAQTSQNKLEDLQAKALATKDKNVKDEGAFAGSVLQGSATPEEAFNFVKEREGLTPALKMMQMSPQEFQNYWKTKQISSVSASEQLTMAQTASRDAQNDKYKAAELKLNQQRVLQESQRLAIERESKVEKNPQVIEVNGKKYEFDPTGKDGTRLSTDSKYKMLGDANIDKVVQRGTVNMMGAGSEVLRGLDTVGQMSAGLTSGQFAEVTDKHSFMSALQASSANRWSTDEQQMYKVSVAGMGTDLGQIIAGNGRTNKTLNHEMQNLIDGVPGDGKYTSLFRLSNAAGIAKTRIENQPALSDPVEEQKRQELIKGLSKYPSPTEIANAARAAGQPISKKTVESASDALNKIKAQIPDTLNSASSAEVQGLSAGAQAAFDKYK